MPKVALPVMVHVPDCAQGVPGSGLRPCAGQLISDPGGLTQYGAVIAQLPPGLKSAVRHWQEVILIDDGEVLRCTGAAAARPTGRAARHG